MVSIIMDYLIFITLTLFSGFIYDIFNLKNKIKSLKIVYILISGILIGIFYYMIKSIIR
jgi:fluoride ion exporter CrcB/FEX